MTRLAALGASFLLLACIACTPAGDEGGKPGGSAGGASGRGGSGGSGSGRGGSNGGGYPTGSGGTSAGSGGSASGGAGGTSPAGTGGTGGGAGGTGGAGMNDAGPTGDTAGGQGGSGGNPMGQRRSPGCGKPRPATIPATLATQGAQQPIIIRVPSAYDPGTAYPLVFGFHGAGLKASDCQGGNCAGVVRVMGEKALLVFMQSFGFNWEGADREKNVKQFSDALEYMKTNFCVDENHVAAVGSSSGATFSNILGCRFGDILRTVSPVAGSVPEKTNCKGTPPTIVIHGVSDNFAGGQSARDWYAMRNGCGAETTPPMAAEIAKVQAARTARMEIHACSSYTSCTGNPVRFCAHSVGGYNGTTHGWPPIGGQLIWDFLMEQK